MMSIFLIILAVVLVVILILLFGPKERVSKDLHFDETMLPDDLDAYLAESEAKYDDMREDTHKRIIWAGTKGKQTALSVIFIHGFSASLGEIRPVPDRVAEGIGANLYFARMRGHGRSSAAMSETRPNDWLLDFAEAMAIGRRIGRKVIVVSVSNGGAITTRGLQFPDMAKDLAALVYIAPNFQLVNKLSFIARLTGARYWGWLLAGREIGFEPLKEGHAKYWTYRYPPSAVVPMLRIMAENDRADMSRFKTPALFMFAKDDKIVNSDRTEKVANSWGANASIVRMMPGPNDDPDQHVVVGDICSPDQTEPAIKVILKWLRSLDL